MCPCGQCFRVLILGSSPWNWQFPHWTGWALHPPFPDSPWDEAPLAFSLQHLICRCLVLYEVAKSVNKFPRILSFVTAVQNKQHVFLLFKLRCVLSHNKNYSFWCLCFHSLIMGVFSVIIYFVIFCFQCQITSVICSFFQNFDSCCWWSNMEQNM